MSTKKIGVIVAAVLIAILLIGEVYIYTFNANATYTIDSSQESDGIHYTVGSKICNDYDLALFDNGDFSYSEEYYIVKDGTYPKYGDPGYISEIVQQMKKRGVEVHTVSASEIRTILMNNLSSDVRQSLIVYGTLPDTVYTGHSSDLLFKWIDHGGRLYWTDSEIGEYYSTEDELVQVENHSTLFFGSECLNTEKCISDEWDDNKQTEVLKLRNSQMKSGVIIDRMPEGKEYIAVGYMADGCSSDTLVRFGNGMVCTIAGEVSYDQVFDLAQIVSSGLCYRTKVIGYETGSLFRDSASGTIACNYSELKNTTFYAYIGGYFLEYARCEAYVGTLP